MKYDPIMCMMVDDSVKTEDASWKAWSLYIDGKFVKSFNSEMPPIKEAKEYMKENHPDKVAKLSRNTGSSSGYVISSRDSNTIDHAIRSCDSREDDIADELFDALQQIRKRNINKNEAEFISEKFFDGKVSSDELMRIFNKYKKEYL